jgi:hypothetical protein
MQLAAGLLPREPLSITDADVAAVSEYAQDLCSRVRECSRAAHVCSRRRCVWPYCDWCTLPTAHMDNSFSNSWHSLPFMMQRYVQIVSEHAPSCVPPSQASTALDTLFSQSFMQQQLDSMYTGPEASDERRFRLHDVSSAHTQCSHWHS